jgi:predicted O-methyltransferase YrrM
MEPVTPLCELAVKYGTDKWGKHTYTPIYYNLLKDKNIKRVLEIGVFKGGSLRMWRDFFPQAMVFGIDNNHNFLFEEEQIQTIYADQSKEEDLQHVVDTIGGNFDLVVDDGSHYSGQQIGTANFFKKHLAPGGILIIEDVKYPNRVSRNTGGKVVECPPAEGIFRRYNDNRLVILTNEQ